tara:strand:+ start:393 stop:524 length:132 start_codon:yes stop_codon:yes gene_type:complete
VGDAGCLSRDQFIHPLPKYLYQAAVTLQKTPNHEIQPVDFAEF